LALIELDLTAPPDQPPSTPPPARRYRRIGLLLAVVLALALGGAAPARSPLWRYLGTVPDAAAAAGRADAPFRLSGGMLYTFAGAGADRVVEAWSPAAPPHRVWTARFPARMTGPDQVPFGGIDARQAGAVVMLSDGPSTTAVDRRTGRVRWTSPVPVQPLAGDRIGIAPDQAFRAGTVYDQDSGEPGALYFSSTGEPHTEPPIRTEVRGLDLRTGATVWSVKTSGAANVFRTARPAAGVLILGSDRLSLRSGDTGSVMRETPLSGIGEATPFTGELVGDTLVVTYGGFQAARPLLVGYATATLERRWERPQTRALVNTGSCEGVVCSEEGGRRTVLDGTTGRDLWRVPDDLDLRRRAGYVIETPGGGSDLPVGVVDAATGTPRANLGGWRAEVPGTGDQPIVLRRSQGPLTSLFGAVTAGRTAVQPLGATSGPVGECTSDERYVVCQADGGLQIWAYRA
jgi:hypothetical protein